MELTRLRHIGNYKRIIVQTKNPVISNIQMQMTCDISVFLGKWNSHANFRHRSHMTEFTHS